LVALTKAVIILRNLVFILTLLVGGSVYAADICQAIFRTHGALIDGRYGQTSQNDDYLEIEGLIGSHGSQLCGPTCLVNSLSKFHRIYGRGTNTMNGPERIADVVRRLFPMTLIDVVRQGSRLTDLGDVMRAAMREEGMNGQVELYSSTDSDSHFAGRVSARTMHTSLRDDTIVIAKLGSYSLESEGPIRRLSGHYVIIAGYNPDVPSEFYVLDPLAPRRFRRMDLATAWPDRFPAQTFSARFNDTDPARTNILIEGLLVAHRSPQ